MPPKPVRRRVLVGSQEVKGQAVEERGRRMEVGVVVVEEEDHRPMGLQKVGDNLRPRHRLRRADLSNDLLIGDVSDFVFSCRLAHVCPAGWLDMEDGNNS